MEKLKITLVLKTASEKIDQPTVIFCSHIQYCEEWELYRFKVDGRFVEVPRESILYFMCEHIMEV